MHQLLQAPGVRSRSQPRLRGLLTVVSNCGCRLSSKLSVKGVPHMRDLRHWAYVALVCKICYLAKDPTSNRGIRVRVAYALRRLCHVIKIQSQQLNCFDFCFFFSHFVFFLWRIRRIFKLYSSQRCTAALGCFGWSLLCPVLRGRPRAQFTDPRGQVKQNYFLAE